MHALFACVDCPDNTCDIDEYYMVHDHLWAEACMGPDDGMLCIGCLESRLGRRLVASDFTPYPVNVDPAFVRSARLVSRLQRREAGR